MSGKTDGQSSEIPQILSLAPVIPVLTVEAPELAVPLARALVAGGLKVLEVTLRTDRALEAARAIMAEVPDAVVGLGTVLTTKQMRAASKVGVRFAVSPGATRALLDAATETGLPYLPAAATASEIMSLLDRGYNHVKFFPAESLGGIAALKALAAPLRDVRFCPTGGIDDAKARAYLDFPFVAAVGGSWVAPGERVTAGDWSGITALARVAASLKRKAQA